MSMPTAASHVMTTGGRRTILRGSALLVVWVLLASCSTLAHRQPRTEPGELNIRGRVDEISVSPAGRIWITTAIGNSYYAEGVGQPFWYGPLSESDSTSFGSLDHSIDRISFFDADTAFATGDIGDEGVENGYVYRTTDGGRNWVPVPYGAGAWIHTVSVGAAGRAWMSGSSGRVYLTEDYARSWRMLSQPFNGKPVISIFMADSLRGYAGTDNNGLRQTTDGGRTWQALRTPVDQGVIDGLLEDGPHLGTTVIGVVGRHLVVEQRGRFAVTRFDSMKWAPLHGNRLVQAGWDPDMRRVVGVTDSLEVVAIDAELAVSALSRDRLKAAPAFVTARRGRVYALDGLTGIWTIQDGRVHFTYPLTRVHETREIRLARERGGRRWGTTNTGLYEWDDSRESWRRRGYFHFVVGGFLPVDLNALIVWDGQGTVVRWDRHTGRTEPIEELDGDDIVDIVQTAPGWFAFGGKQYETTFRVDVSRTFFGGQFRGSRDYGFVYVSTDRGATWTRIDRWQEGGVQLVAVTPRGDVVLLSYLGSVRRLYRTADGYEARTLVTADSTNRFQVPYVERAHSFWFADDSTGFIHGWIHQRGLFSFRTDDGGATWKPIRPDAFGYDGLVACPGRGAMVYSLSQLFYLQDTSRTAVALPQPTRGAPITAISLVDDDRLLVLTNSDTYNRPALVYQQWQTVDLPEPCRRSGGER